MTTSSNRRGAALLLLILVVVACGRGAPDGPPAGKARLSLLAVGDTGESSHGVWKGARQGLVAEALASEAGRRPIDALVLLGDNFYESGLRADEIVTRLRQNIVAPYCRFVELAGPASAKVASACQHPASDRHPVPIFAVLGNHDHYTPGSAKLQRETVPLFISNWHMPASVAGAYELGQGVSLIRLGLVAGSGSRVQAIGQEDSGRRFGRKSLGFARVDLVEEGDAQRLVGSLYAVSGLPAPEEQAPHLVARWSVDREGRVRNEATALPVKAAQPTVPAQR
ncbi:MAG: metallophosphoesterase [Deltaproteobacteria bacterium]|nr:metallophosphoesterase [Deltaproteobacteria bacterium]